MKPGLSYEAIVVGAFEVNCWILRAEERKALVIDPGADADRILARLRALKLEAALYVLTHGHVDHVCGVADCCDAQPAPVAISREDGSWAFTPDNEMPPYYPAPRAPATRIRHVADGDESTDAGVRWRVISTPGHTPGSVCIHLPDHGLLFSGDTVFAGSVGRTDLPGGSSRTLNASLKKLLSLPDDVRVCCGHGPETDMRTEKRTNFFFRQFADTGSRNHE